jgi:hypothetical protein
MSVMIISAYFLTGLRNVIMRDHDVSLSYENYISIVNKEKYEVDTFSLEIAYKFVYLDSQHILNITG